ncbi:MAG: TonB-dependent receptor [Amphiplicatus sp.]
MKSTGLAARLMRSTILTGVAATAAMPAFAQDEGDDVIYVTGSRIQREDLQAPSPVTTVSTEQLVLTNTVNSEQFLNTLPQVIPSFDSTSNNPGDGTARVSLRGLGTQRTLVLVDGARFVPSGAGTTVDLNNIPPALVERIDVVTGGASAVYGSDAMAGVVNFILKDDFQGVQFDVSHELSAAGWDANTTNVALTVGGNFADGRGNAVFSASYTNREALLQGERDFSKDTFFDPGVGGTEFILGGSSNIPGTRFRGATSSNFGIDPTTVDSRCATNVCSGFWVDGAGEVRGLRFGGADPTTDLYNYAPFNYLQLPQERYSISGIATFDINDHIELYARGIFANNVVDSQLAPTPTGTLTVDVNLDNPLIPADLLAIIANDPNSNNGDGTATIRINRRMEELGTRNSLRDTSSFQIITGLRGDINENWSYDAYFNFSRSSISQIQSGNISVSAFEEALLCDGGPTAVASGCDAPALDIFNGPGSVSPAAADFINRTGAQIDSVETIQIVGTLSGDLTSIQSPWANSAPAVVLGFEYRENQADSIPDSVLGPDVRGFNQSLPVGGRFDVYEGFFETTIPVISGAPLFESFQINGAYRYSDYSIANVGGTHTFAGGLDWELISGLRLRGQFQRAVRAPNIAELFSAFTNGFPGASDPCSGGTFGGFDSTVDVSQCIATGVPAALVGTSFQSNAQIEALFGGNPDLFEESSDTWTVGMVWQPDFVPGMSLTVDYYNIEVEDAISTVPLQTLFDECYRFGITASCQPFFGARNPSTGEIANPFIPNLGAQNIARLKVEGVDFNLTYAFDADQIGLPASAGSFTARYYGSYAIENGFQTSPSASFVDCVGLYGQECGEPTPEYKHTAQFSWLYGPLTTSLRWRYLSSMDADEPTLNAFGGISDLSDDISSFNYLDVTLQWAATDNIDLTVGVQNITGKEPPVLGSTASEQANTWPATYETLGRQLFFGASLKF